MKFSGERLRQARKAMRDNGHAVSQERFAELVGCSRRSPGRWENGESAPRMRQLGRIVAVTKRDITFFFVPDGPGEGGGEDKNEAGEPDLMRAIYSELRSIRVSLEQRAALA